MRSELLMVKLSMRFGALQTKDMTTERMPAASSQRSTKP